MKKIESINENKTNQYDEKKMLTYAHKNDSIIVLILLTASNCFRYVDAELLAWISAWPWLNIVAITKPKENISLNTEQLENSWTSGAVYDWIENKEV